MHASSIIYFHHTTNTDCVYIISHLTLLVFEFQFKRAAVFFAHVNIMSCFYGRHSAVSFHLQSYFFPPGKKTFASRHNEHPVHLTCIFNYNMSHDRN